MLPLSINFDFLAIIIAQLVYLLMVTVADHTHNHTMTALSLLHCTALHCTALHSRALLESRRQQEGAQCGG